jgi:uncharacterized protein
MKGFRHAPLTVSRLLLGILLCTFTTTAFAERLEDLPKPTDYVSDYAHVLSPDTIARLDSLCAQLDHSAANAQIAVVTVRNLNGEDAADYANALEDKWKIGKKGSDKGLLVLLAVDDHKYRIDVGYGLEGILPDGKVGDIGREMVPYLRSTDYDGAISQAVGEVAQVIAGDANVTLSDQPAMARPPARHGGGGGKIILLLIVLLFFGGFHILRFLLGFGLFSGLAGGWRGAGGMGGGGFGGGGGSGFGGFGGGSFGGGGAGGSW